MDDSQNTRVLVFGAAGRMGATVCQAIANDPELQLVAAIDPTPTPPGDHTFQSLTQLDPSATKIDVAVDFTVATAAKQNAIWCAEHGIHAVIGTTGLTEADLADLQSAFTAAAATGTSTAGTSNCLVAPNFAIGAVLLMKFAEQAAPFFGSAEVIEQHHDAKVDAPSGTALQILQRMAAASNQWHPDPTKDQIIPGARGGKGPADIPVHSVRMRGLVAHHQIMFGTDGEVLTLRHDSLDRNSFMSGVLHACKVISNHPGLTVGLETYLGI